MNEVYYQIVGYTKDGEYDHDVGELHYNKTFAEQCAEVYQKACGKSTGLIYKVEERKF